MWSKALVRGWGLTLHSPCPLAQPDEGDTKQTINRESVLLSRLAAEPQHFKQHVNVDVDVAWLLLDAAGIDNRQQ